MNWYLKRQRGKKRTSLAIVKCLSCRCERSRKNLLFLTFYNGFIVHMAYGNNRKETELNTGIFHENSEETTPIKQMPNIPTINDV